MKIPDYSDEHLILGLIFLLSNRFQAIGDKLYDEITTKQWFVLVILEIFKDDYPTMNELSKALGSSHQNVKQLVLKLERNGFVELISDDQDKRKCRVKMTGKCQEINKKYKSKQNELMQAMFQEIAPEDLKATVKTLGKLEESMEGLK